MSLIRSYKNVIVIIIICLALSLFFFSPALTETIYGQYLFPFIRVLLIPFSWIPFPVLYLLIPLLLYGFIRVLRGNYKIVRKLWSLGFAFFILFLLFFVLWAFNYRRTDFAQRYPILVSKLDSLGLANELLLAKNELIRNRPAALRSYKPSMIEDSIRPLVKMYCTEFGYSSPGAVRVKILPAGMLLRIKTAGFYLPFAGEAYVDGGLHPIQLPFTQAHEMCHGYGVTDEGACNFLAYLATIHVRDSTIKYSGMMGYYRYVAGEYRYHFPKVYQRMRDSLPATIQNDLDEINKQLLKYPDIFPRFRDRVYNKYLTVMRVPGGMASYDKIIDDVRQARLLGLLPKD